jgi:ribosomal protein S1
MRCGVESVWSSLSFAVNDSIEAVVVSLDKENRRMSLSIKQLEKNSFAQQPLSAS